MNFSERKNWKWKENQGSKTSLEAIKCHGQPLLPGPAASCLKMSFLFSAPSQRPCNVVEWTLSWEGRRMVTVAVLLIRVWVLRRLRLVCFLKRALEFSRVSSLPGFPCGADHVAPWSDSQMASIGFYSLCILFPGWKNHTYFCSHLETPVSI